MGQGGAKSDWTTAYAVAGAPVPSPATLTLSVANKMVEENVGTVRVTAALDNPAGANGVNVTLSTRGTAARAGAVASGREDYRLTPDVLEIRVGATTGTATVSIVDDTTGELDETIILSATSSITNITGTTITIRDNDGGPPSPPPPPPPVLSSDATLSALALSAGALAFAPETTDYAVAVPYAVGSVTVTPAASDSGATVTVNGVEVPSGEASAAIALAVGETVIEVVVTARNGATRTYTVTVTRGPAELALLPVASGGLFGAVRIRAFDDAGTEYAPVTLAIGAGEARHFNATDLESGNPDKGLTGATGAPEAGRWWRLVFESELGLRVMGYVRTGPLDAMHDEVTETQSQDGYRYEVVFFNPASNAGRASVLRVVNRSDAQAAVTITGLDDAGRAGDEAVTLRLPAGAARMLSAPALESGEGEGLEGALGDGTGKWRLVVASDRPLGVMSLNRSLDGHLSNLSTAPAGAGPDGVHRLALLPAASGGLHGFVRVVNASDEAGTVRIRAFDDAGTEYDPVTLAIGAGEARHFNATDLESGNPDKGLTGATGALEAGRWWRLVFESELGVRVMGYVRTGPLGAMHDEVTETQSQDGYRYEVVFFNPASNAARSSVLRVVNRSGAEAAVTITGTDDAGRAGDEAVTLTLPAGAARMLGAPALESGGEEFDGALGDGTGKWRLVVASDRPLAVMSLLRSLEGHLANLSTAPPASRTKRR